MAVGVPVVLVDLGGVLFDFDHGHRLGELGRCLQIAPERVDELLWDSGFSTDCDAGRYPSADDVRSEIRRITGYAGAEDALDEAWCSAFRPNQELIDLLAAQDGTRLGVFTNNGPLEEDVLTRRHPSAFAPFDDTFFCWRLVANKPDAAVYEQVTSLLGVPAAGIRFVDDGADNVEAARAAGWTAVEYHEVADLAGLMS